MESDRAGVSLAPDPIHDLRVALRRCRSMAAGYMAIDPDKDWVTLTRAARRLFRRLGEMRDAQVMEEWANRLGSPDDPVSGAVLFHLAQNRQELESGVVKALQEFDRQKWTRWARRLKGRTRRIPVAGAVFQLSALGAWEEAYRLHKAALRNRSALSWHRLRIGLKKFRYLVENFLPLRHEEWKDDLKELQDCLGEFHDLIVFWNLAARIRAFPDEQSRDQWRQILENEKTGRLKTYRDKMLGDAALWRLWRDGLPGQSRLHSLALTVLQKWASLQGADLGRVRAERRLALQLYDGLHPRRRSDSSSKMRRVTLHAAVILRGLRGIKKGKADAAKSSGELLERLPPLPGFLDIVSIGRLVTDEFLTGRVDRVDIAFTAYVNMLRQEPTVEPLLPLQLERRQTGPASGPALVYTYEPSQKEIVNTIVPRLVEMQIYQAILESLASEHSARMVAMRSATDNANELMNTLQLTYNKARQLSITSDLLDIVGGVNALAQAEES